MSESCAGVPPSGWRTPRDRGLTQPHWSRGLLLGIACREYSRALGYVAWACDHCAAWCSDQQVRYGPQWAEYREQARVVGLLADTLLEITNLPETTVAND